MDNEPLVEFVPVAKQELVLIVPKGHPLDGKTSIDLKEALTYPHIVFSKRSGLRHVIDKLFEKCGGYPQIAYSMEEDQGVAGLSQCRIRHRSCAANADSFLFTGFNHRNFNSVLGRDSSTWQL